MSAQDKNALAVIVNEEVAKLAATIAANLHTEVSRMAATAISKQARPAGLSKELVDDILEPAITASVLKRLSSKLESSAEEWRHIYHTNSKKFFTDEWFIGKQA